jgi:PTEN phosphatase family protein
MVCSYLVYSKKFQTSKEALNYFAERRTDKSVGEKFQGVETPSQSRYVEYFTQITTQMEGKVPEPKPLRVKNIKIYSLLGIGAGNGSDFTCNIFINRETVFNLDFGIGTNCRTDYDSVADVLTIEPINCPLFLGDVRLKFNCKTKSVPRAYEDCAFYFWFNTSFVNNNKFRLDRTEIDNPHKQKTWKLYREYFSIELNFDSNTNLSNNL